MKARWNLAKRALAVTAITVTALALASVPSGAVDSVPRVTVDDRPGAPGEMLRQLETLSGQPIGDLNKVLAIDTAGRDLTIDQLEALVAGESVDGVRVLGEMRGGPELLDTTMADLSDGAYDGPRDTGTSTSTLLFTTAIPEYREWCLTMCIVRGKTVLECIMARGRL